MAVHLVVDSTGLKIFGEGEWLAQKHKIKGIRRRWRKLHLGLDLASGAIVCADLTDDDAGDSTALPGLLDQLDAPVTGFLADGAYDGASTRDLLRERYRIALPFGMLRDVFTATRQLPGIILSPLRLSLLSLYSRIAPRGQIDTPLPPRGLPDAGAGVPASAPVNVTLLATCIVIVLYM